MGEALSRRFEDRDAVGAVEPEVGDDNVVGVAADCGQRAFGRVFNVNAVADPAQGLSGGVRVLLFVVDDQNASFNVHRSKSPRRPTFYPETGHLTTIGRGLSPQTQRLRGTQTKALTTKYAKNAKNS